MHELVRAGLVAHVGHEHAVFQLHRLFVENIDVAFRTHEHGHEILLALA